MDTLERGAFKAIGKPLPRKEDFRLITGHGRYADDFNMVGQAYAAMVRSPYPHARILGIDATAARFMPGVLAIFTGADCRKDGLAPIPHDPVPSTKYDMKLTHEIFAGNVQDRASLATMLDRLGERIGLKQGATVVLDRGMAYDDDLAASERASSTTLSPVGNPSATAGSPTSRIPMALRRCGASLPCSTPPKRRPRSRSRPRVEDKGTPMCSTSSEQRIAKDHAIRSKHEQRLLADIDKLSRRIADKRLVKPEKIDQAIGRLKERYPRVARYYNLSHDPQTANLVAVFDPDKHAKAGRARRLLSAQNQPQGPLRRRALAHLRVAHPRRERLSRHEVATRRTADLPSTRAPRGSSHLPLRPSLSPAHLDRENSYSIRVSIPLGQPCARPSKRIRSARSSCPPVTVQPCAFERPQPPSTTSSTSIAPSASVTTSSSRNTHGRRPIVTNK